MASLRDVLNHAGKKVRVQTGTSTPREGLAMRRGDVGLLEPKLVPAVGDTVEFVESHETFRVEDSQEERQMEKIDHYRVRLAPARG